MNGIVTAFTLTGAISLALQVTTPDMSGLYGPIERLTLVGALIIGIRVLWASNQRKDAEMTQIISKVSEVMTMTLDAVKELRISTDQKGIAIDGLSANIMALKAAVYVLSKVNDN